MTTTVRLLLIAAGVGGTLLLIGEFGGGGSRLVALGGALMAVGLLGSLFAEFVQRPDRR